MFHNILDFLNTLVQQQMSLYVSEQYLQLPPTTIPLCACYGYSIVMSFRKGYKSSIIENGIIFGKMPSLNVSLNSVGGCPRKKTAAQRSKVTYPKFICIAYLLPLSNITYSYRILACTNNEPPRQIDGEKPQAAIPSLRGRK